MLEKHIQSIDFKLGIKKNWFVNNMVSHNIRTH